MCEANVFIAKDGVESEVMREVEVISVTGNRLAMENFSGERKELAARIVFVDFDEHKVVLEETP